MYQLASLSKQSIDFINTVGASGAARSPLFAIAVGYCVGRNLALPVNVDDLSSYYREQVQNDVVSLLDKINNVVPHNFEESKNAVLAFFKFRYSAANPKVIPLAFSKESAVEDFFGLSEFFSKGVLDAIRCEPDALTRFVSNVTNIMLELAAASKQLDASYERSDYNQTSKDSASYVAP